jgi:hypothetical protein
MWIYTSTRYTDYAIPAHVYRVRCLIEFELESHKFTILTKKTIK